MKKIIFFCLLVINVFTCQGKLIHISLQDSVAADKFFNQGDSLLNSYKFELAALSFMKAAEKYRELNNDPRYFTCMTKQIVCNIRIGDLEQVERLENILKSNSALTDQPSRQLVSLYMAMAVARKNKGAVDSGLEYDLRALEVNESLKPPDIWFDAILHNNIGTSYRKKGDPNRAIEYLVKALELKKTNFPEKRKSIAITLSNLGLAYDNAEKFELGNEMYNMARELLLGQETPSMISLMINMGIKSMLEGKYDEALNFHNNALKISRKIYGENHFRVSRSINNLGKVNNAMKNFDEAIKYYHESLRIRLKIFGPKHPDIALTYDNLGDNYYEAGRFDEALSYYQKAIVANVPSFNDTAIYANPKIGLFLNKLDFLNMLYGKGMALKEIAGNNQDIVKLNYALNTVRSADTLIQQLRNAHLDYSDKIALGKESAGLYELAININKQLYKLSNDHGYHKSAFYFAEQNKAAVLTEALADQSARKFTSISTKLIDQEKNIKINQSYFRTKIQNAEIAKNGYDTTQFLSWKEKLFNLNRKLDSLSESFQQNFPKYYDLKYSNQTMTVEEVQDKLNDNEAFLEYFVGDSASYVFSITNGDFDIISLAQDSSRNTEIAQFRQTLQSSLTTSNSTARFIEQSRNLYNKYLSEAINGLPDHIDKLTIVGDGALSYIPFDILLNEEVTASNPGYQDLPYLLKKFQVSFGHSAKLLFQKSNEEVSDGNKNFIAFAPSYSGGTDSLRSFKYGKFRDQVTSLKWNTPEIEGINEYMKGTLFSGKEAVEKAFKSSVDQYNIVHLAMHALIDDEEPMNSKLIFSQVQDSTEDNFLHAYELYNMQLPAQMVVLSACETGFGKLEKGEGVMSLARAFAYAGCPSVVMSHWAVNDATTAKVMTKFYKHLSDGYSKDGALRQAKLDFLAEAGPAQANPLFWGSFVVMGDTAPINKGKFGSAIYILAALILVLVLVFVGMRRRSKV